MFWVVFSVTAQYEVDVRTASVKVFDQLNIASDIFEHE